MAQSIKKLSFTDKKKLQNYIICSTYVHQKSPFGMWYMFFSKYYKESVGTNLKLTRLNKNIHACTTPSPPPPCNLLVFGSAQKDL